LGNKASFTIVDEVASFRIMEATSIASVTIAASDKKVLYSEVGITITLKQSRYNLNNKPQQRNRKL
jgi:hypothetical protein